MLAASQVQTPLFFVERDLERLVGLLPVEAIATLKWNMGAFRATIAQPALIAESSEKAVEHMLESAGIAAQIKVEFVKAISSVPDGLEIFLRVIGEHLGDLVEVEAEPMLLEAVDHLQAAQRLWYRFLAFYPDLPGVEQQVGINRLMAIISFGFQADSFLTVCLMGASGDCESRPEVLSALCVEARTWAERYQVAIQELAEELAPKLDEAEPFAATTLDDIMSLPPFDGPATTIDQMDEAIATAFDNA